MTIRYCQCSWRPVATVSKVLNHRDQNISQETKERILQIIKDSGYVPYAKIRDRLLTGTNTIGLAVPSLDISYYASFVSRVQALARQQGFVLSLSITGGSSEEELAALESFRDTKAVGILFFPCSEEGLQALQQLHAEGYGAVILDYMMENAVCPQVFRANDRMAKQCTELLLDHCQHIALLTHRKPAVSCARPCVPGMRRFCWKPTAPLTPGWKSMSGQNMSRYWIFFWKAA